MTITVPKNQVEKCQKAFGACGYGQASEDILGGSKVLLTLTHGQLCTKKEMLEYLREEGVKGAK